MTILRSLFLAVFACTTLFLAIQNQVVAQTLEVGSKAPALDIEYWVSDGDGAFDKVTEFKPGKIYVVEFWATWCGPCIQSMPHLAELQEKYKDKIQIISVTDESIDEVKALMKQPYSGTDKTFGELTSVYCLTSDPDGSTNRDYMEAADVRGVPSAFIVGPTGEIEVIDHPMGIDGILKKMVAGTWDREKYYADQKKTEQIFAKIEKAIDAQDVKAAFEASLELDDVTDESDLKRTKLMQTQLAVSIGDREAMEFFVKTADQLKDEDGAIAAMVWMIVQMKYEGEEPTPEMVQLAESVIKKNISELPTNDQDRLLMKGAVMDILSHLFYVQGKLDDAIANQEDAVKLNDDAELTDFLKKMKAEKADK